MRTISAAHSVLYDIGHYQTQVRVKVEDGDGTLQDLTDFKGYDWVEAGSWGEDIDSFGMTAEIQLTREIFDDSMAPLVEGTRVNLNSGGSYDPLLDLTREVVIEAATLPLGVEPDSGDWVEQFRGQIDSIEWSKETVTIQCRDQSATLIDRWVETIAVYGGTSGSPQDVEDAMQDILDAELGSGAVSLYTPTSPGWAITEFESEHQSIKDQLQMLADMIGWDLRYKWDSGTSAFRLTFYEIDRSNTTPDHTFGPDDYEDVTKMQLDLSRIRNVVQVSYQTGNDDDSGEPVVATYESTDATSIAAYGRRWMAITEEASSHIDTSTEAQAMSDACLADLKDPVAWQSVRLVGFFGEVELGDLYTFTANGRHYDQDTDLAVIGYRHSFDVNDIWTEITSEGSKPKGSVNRWYEKFAIKGLSKTQDTSGPDIGSITATEVPGGVAVDIPAVRDALNGGRPVTRAEIYVGTSSGFSPSASTYWGKTSDRSVFIPMDDISVPAGETVYVKVIGVDERNNKGATIASSGVSVGRYGTASLADDTPIAAFPGEVLSQQTRGTDYPPDFWDMTTGTWAIDAILDS